MTTPGYQIEPIVSAPFAEITYLAWRNGSADALVVDPGFEVDAILEVLERHALRPVAILNTHGHVDHIAGNAGMKDAFPEIPLIIGKNEANLLTDANANHSARFGMPITSPPADRFVTEGERIELAGFSFEVREIPGHSPGSVVFVADEFDPPFVFGGDVLFAGSVGRTDLGGDTKLLLSGIRAKLFNLPDGTVILPGHGPSTTIGAERVHNPFVGSGARYLE